MSVTQNAHFKGEGYVSSQQKNELQANHGKSQDKETRSKLKTSLELTCPRDLPEGSTWEVKRKMKKLLTISTLALFLGCSPQEEASPYDPGQLNTNQKVYCMTEIPQKYLGQTSYTTNATQKGQFLTN
jgi:hypothetical protein